MAHADVLYDFVLMVAKFVKIAIDSGKIHILVKVVFQIFHRSSLARWICQTSLYKLAEHFIVNTIETNPVKRAVQYSENAVRTHLWVAIIAYLIIAKIKADYKSPFSITEVATLIRISALDALHFIQ